MSKAILVVDMPECCAECGFCKSAIDFGRWFDYCDITNLEVSGEIISDNCPLKPLPEKKEIMERRRCENQRVAEYTFYNLRNEGYNACIDDILGNKNGREG